MKRLGQLLSSHAQLGLALLLIVGLTWWLLRPSAGEGRLTDRVEPGTPAARLALALATQGLLVAPEQVLLPPVPGSGGLGPLAWRVALCAAGDGQGGGDLYRVEVRFAADGTLLDLGPVHNLTETASAAERLLLAAGPLSLWSVEVDALVQGLLLVDLRGDTREFEKGAGRLQRLMAAVSNRLQTGVWRGVGVDGYTLRLPASRVEARAGARPTEAELLLYRGAAEPDARLTFDLDRRETASELAELTHTPRLWGGTPFIHWLVDLVRDLPWVGTRPVALLEKWVFTAQNSLESLAYRLGLVEGEAVGDQLGVDTAQPVPPTEIAVADGEPLPPGEEWPPPPLAPLVPGPQEGEGVWYPFTAPWLKTLPGAPPAFYKTALRTPGKPPYLVFLVALDLRQLDLGLVAGLYTPWSSTGKQGSGRIPREPALLARTVAAFNGGFQTAHGAFGMQVDGQLVLEPWQKTATVALRDDGTVLFGTWNNSLEVPAHIRSFRQNMPPLLEDGVWNPMNQRYWGGTVSDLDQVNTTRSAVGYRGSNQLVYAFSQRISAKAIAEALLHAGCQYGLHLDMNPAHAGFALLDIDPGTMEKRGTIPGYKAQAPNKAQSFDMDRFVNRNGKDFFYLSLRPTLPTRLPEPPPGFGPWEGRGGGAQPFLPPIALARTPDGQQLLAALELPRLRAQLVPGSSVGLLLPEGAQPLAPGRATLRSPLALLDLGPVDPARPVGLAFAGRTIVPSLASLATLGLDDAGRLQLLPPAAPGRGAALPDQLQAQPLLVQGELSRGGATLLRAGKDARHHLLGRGPADTLLYLTSPAPVEELVATLTSCGVTDALLLPDGEGSRLALLHRSDTGLLEEPLLSGTSQPLALHPAAGSRLLFDLTPAPARVERLRLPDVELSPEEQQRQQRIQARIKEKRAELRAVSNAAYKAYIEKVREKRSAADAEAE
ncbi:MAG: hypothetical protein RBU45_06820 [Myxococcota bacterium]|nr:hypothetical protein [Myxococcota bacterium]